MVEPVRLAVRDGEVVVRNLRHTASTADLAFTWRLERDGEPVASGPLEVPEVPAGESAAVALPDLPAAAEGGEGGAEDWLTVTGSLREDAAWAAAGHVVTSTQVDVTGPRAVRTAAPVRDRIQVAADGATAQVGPAVLDLRTGTLRAVGRLAVDGPRLELWRAPTDNDRGGTPHAYEDVDPRLSGGEGSDAPPSAERWRALGLDRLEHRTVAVEVGPEVGPDEVVVRSRAGIAASDLGVDVTDRWTASGGEAHLAVDVVPTGAWTGTWPRVGVRLDLPASTARAQWFGTRPQESYPDSDHAAVVGRFASDVDDLVVRYARPQQSGHRPDLRRLELTGPAAGLRVRSLADRPGEGRVGFTARRWTPQELAVAAHDHELPPSERVVLHLDAAQHGLGSRACGIDVLPEHQLRPGARAFRVALGPTPASGGPA